MFSLGPEQHSEADCEEACDDGDAVDCFVVIPESVGVAECFEAAFAEHVDELFAVSSEICGRVC